ncbi:MAG: hypothetical protein KC657_40005, partial [Myxococcales bacterium]|nr:hypothetical protein [Myxococcales bacterium]
FRPDRWAAFREDYRFTGKEEDVEVGVTYFGARYYQAQLGRWMSADPLAIHAMGADLNPYAYVGGDVLGSVDPLGLFSVQPPPGFPAGPKADGYTANMTVEAQARRAPAPTSWIFNSARMISSTPALAIDSGRVASALADAYRRARISLPGDNGYFRPAGVAATAVNAATSTLVRGADPVGYTEIAKIAGADVTSKISIDTSSSDPNDHTQLVGTVSTFVAGMILAKAAPKSFQGVGRSYCFAAGTKVLMADGATKRIEDVREGDEVVADDPSDREGAQPRTVTHVHQTATYRLFHIEVDQEDGGEIVATGSHPFWTQRGWVTAEELTIADRLSDHAGRPVAIRAIALESRDAATFNLSVDGTHTFFVVAGSTPVLVHNVDPWEIQFSQDSYGATFAEGSWAGRSLAEAISEARGVGALPRGLTLNVMEVNGRWVTLNNRTLGVARQANLSQVPVNNVGPSGINKLQRLLKGANLISPVENAVMRCK